MSNNITIPKGERVFFRKKLFNWHKKNRRAYIWRDVDDPYVVLVAEVFLQKTPANRVANFLPKFLKKYPNLKGISKASLFDLEQLIKPLGLVKRAKWLRETSIIILDNFKGEIPRNEKELRQLKGVGQYTARAILTFAFKKDVAMLDVNIKRFISRFFGMIIYNQSDKKKLQFLERLIPEGFGPQFNEAILDFSAIICKNNPFCFRCEIKMQCNYFSRIK